MADLGIGRQLPRAAKFSGAEHYQYIVTCSTCVVRAVFFCTVNSRVRILTSATVI